ncbi:MAG: MBL fold metallo-hydrolase [Candidatus Woesearchaeota archaeon]
MKYKLLIILMVILSACSSNNLELYAVKYGDSSYDSDNIYYEDELEEDLPFAWMFYVIKYNEKIILIDTGFSDQELIEKYDIDYKDPLELLKKLNIEPSQVTDVIITHSHFDHIGNVDKFPDSKIYIQKDELEKFKSREILKDNIITFDDVYWLYSIIKIEKIGGHTIGSSVVSFKDNILTGDECYLLDNCKGKPIGTYYDIEKNKEFIEKLRTSNKKILTFHDPLIFEEINSSIARII